MNRYPRITRVHDHEREERRYMVDEGGAELTGPSFLTRAEATTYLEEVRARMPPKVPKPPKVVRRYCDVCGVCLRLEWMPATCRKCGGVGPVWKRPIKATTEQKIFGGFVGSGKGETMMAQFKAILRNASRKP